MTHGPDVDWIGDGEKFAVVGLHVRTDPALEGLHLPDGLTALPKLAFELPDYWEKWLETLRVEEMEECSLFLLAKMRASALDVDDAESEALRTSVGQWYLGLIHVTKFFQGCDAFLASGSCDEGKIDVSRFDTLVPPHKSVVDHYPAISAADLKRAAEIGARLRTFVGPWQGHHWRLFRCREIYQTARFDRDMLNRIHQFTRCIEGLVVPEQGKTRRQFVSRTELFVGQSHRELMGELYDDRSHFEHLHEYRTWHNSTGEHASDWPSLRPSARALPAIALREFF